MRTNDPAVLEESYQGYIQMIPKKPYPTLKGIQFMLDMLAEKMPQAKTAKPAQFVDLSFLHARENENFFNAPAQRYPPKRGHPGSLAYSSQGLRSIATGHEPLT